MKNRCVHQIFLSRLNVQEQDTGVCNTVIKLVLFELISGLRMISVT